MIMARREEDREDLFAELALWVPRWELRVPHEVLPVVLAQRSDGRLAIYFGQDPCFHFNEAGQLLRAFIDGSLYRTQGDMLARLQRQRRPGETQLLRTDLRDVALREFLLQVSFRIQLFVDSLLQLDAADVLVLRATEPGRESLTRVASWLSDHLHPLQLAPAYPTRKR